MTTTEADLLDAAVRVVWPGAVPHRLGPAAQLRRRPRPGPRDFLVLPGLRAPRWLVPADLSLPADLLATGAGAAWKRRALQTTSVLVRYGMAPYLPLARLRIDGTSSLLPVLEHAVGVSGVRVAIRLGRWAQPRALVLRIFAPTGATVGFAKLSLSAAGQDSVRAEAAGLALAASLPVRSVRAPRVLHTGRWQDELLLVTEPLPSAASRARRSPIPVAAMSELALTGGARRLPVTGSGWLASVSHRVGLVPDEATRARFRRVLRLLGEDAAAGVALEFGPWHGDWTPWNMAYADGQVLLWDWEHAAADVPIGFDHVHYLAQRLRVVAGTGVRAEQRWLAQSAAVLERHLGLDRAQRDLLLVAYLLEVNLRYVLDRPGSTGTPRSGWGMPLLEARAGRARRVAPGRRR